MLLIKADRHSPHRIIYMGQSSCFTFGFVPYETELSRYQIGIYFFWSDKRVVVGEDSKGGMLCYRSITVQRKCLLSISHGLHPRIACFPIDSLLILSSAGYICQLHPPGSSQTKTIYYSKTPPTNVQDIALNYFMVRFQ